MPESPATLTTLKRPTEAQESGLRAMILGKGETVASPRIGPTPNLYRKLCALGWADDLGNNRFRITDAGRRALK